MHVLECRHWSLRTFLGLLNACASEAALEEGQQIHKQIIQNGWESDLSVGNSLVDMYVKCGVECGSVGDAWSVFTRMNTRNVVSWNSMILGYTKCGQGQKALELFRQMQLIRVVPDHVTFLGLLNACATLVALEEGRNIHKQIIQSGYQSDGFLGTCLVDMYVKCGSIEDAQQVFHELLDVFWNWILATTHLMYS